MHETLQKNDGIQIQGVSEMHVFLNVRLVVAISIQPLDTCVPSVACSWIKLKPTKSAPAVQKTAMPL